MVLLAGCARTVDPERVYCINSAKGTCAVSIFALLANPSSAYSDLTIWTAGYLSQGGGGVFYLFPDKEWARFSYTNNAIQVIPRNETDLLEMERLNEGYVVIIGDLVSTRCPVGCWGSLRLVRELGPMAYYAPEPPLPPPGE